METSIYQFGFETDWLNNKEIALLLIFQPPSVNQTATLYFRDANCFKELLHLLFLKVISQPPS